MNNQNIGCRIITGHAKPNQDIVEKFKKYPVSNIDDCMNRTGAINQEIRPVNNATMVGTAFTVKVPQGDNLMFHKAMDLASPGDVIVIDAGGMYNRAILGELMVNYCITKKFAGIVVDGCIRDYDALSKIDFPVYARGVSPNGPYKNGPGEIGTTISVGGKIINHGDIIVGDADGVVAIDPKDAEILINKVEDVMEAEHSIMSKIKKDGTYIRPWVDEKLKEINCEYIDIKNQEI